MAPMVPEAVAAIDAGGYPGPGDEVAESREPKPTVFIRVETSFDTHFTKSAASPHVPLNTNALIGLRSRGVWSLVR